MRVSGAFSVFVALRWLYNINFGLFCGKTLDFCCYISYNIIVATKRRENIGYQKNGASY